MKAGAHSFVEKPIEPDTLLTMLERAIERRDLVGENQLLKQKLEGQFRFGNIIGKSKKMHEVLELVESVAGSDANILIQGENGTGKELIANALHYNSKRVKGPFIKINCAAIPKDLIESELFGYKKGAFTGAQNDKEGLFEMAEGGSLLLDEIGEMPPYLQTKLLRVLQEREYRPIGSDRVVRVDFRLICATNVDLDAALRDGKLREDLYFRINTITLRVPPLREKTEDIPLLCEHFLEKYRERHQRNVKSIAPGRVSPAHPASLARERSRARERHRTWSARGQGTGDRGERSARVAADRDRRGRPTSWCRPTGPWPRSSAWRSSRLCSGRTGTSRRPRRFSASTGRRCTAR